MMFPPILKSAPTLAQPRPFALLVWLFLLLGVVGPSAAARPALRVVGSVPDIAVLARQIAGDRAEVSVLLRGRDDPLSLAAQPEQALVLSRADLLVALGGPLEAGWLGDLLPAARNPRMAEYLDATRLLGGPSGPTASGGGARPCGLGSYPLGDPRQAVRLSQAIAEQLAVLDPAGATAYRAAAAALSADLAAREKTWLLHLAPLRGQKVVTYDDSFRAFLCWAGLAEAVTLSPAPGMPPPAVAVLRTLRLMRESNIRLILLREYEPAQAARTLMEKSGAQGVVTPLGARFERGERYADGVEQLVHALLGAQTARSIP